MPAAVPPPTAHSQIPGATRRPRRASGGRRRVFRRTAALPLAAAGILAGLFFLEPGRFSFGARPEYLVFSQSVLLLVYAFTGFEMAVIPAGETRNPRAESCSSRSRRASRTTSLAEL